MREDAERSKEKKYEELLQFYERLASKLVVFDPLNRPILDDDEFDMATKRDQLITEINTMEQLNTRDLNVMMSPDRLDLLEDLFEKKEREVKDICDEQMKAAKDSGEVVDHVSLKQDPIIAAHMSILDFFAGQALLVDSQDRLDNFMRMVDGADE
jgi:hypothetical protein